MATETTENAPNTPDIPPPPIREELVNTAVKFLINPSVQKSAVSNREAFLRNKGLTEQEIQVAFQRSQSAAPPQQQSYGPPQPYTAVPMPYQQGYLLPPQTGWSRFKELVNNVAIIGGLIYGLYVLYKRYIAPFLFGTSRAPSAVEASLSSLEASVKQSVEEMRTELQKVATDVERIAELQASPEKMATAKQVLDVRGEVASLKGLLLNRKQFPTTVEPPTTSSIPAWQLTDEEADLEKGRDFQEASSNHSNSTTDTVHTNCSDSSVELIGTD